MVCCPHCATNTESYKTITTPPNSGTITCIIIYATTDRDHFDYIALNIAAL